MNLMPWRRRSENSSLGQTRWMRDIEDRMERLFQDPWGELTGMAREAMIVPRMDVTESDDDVTVRFELPGVKRDDIDIEVTGDRLVLRGQKSSQHNESRRDLRITETEYGSFSRVVQLPSGVDTDNVEANFRDGILCVTMKKHPDLRPRRIPVQIEGDIERRPNAE